MLRQLAGVLLTMISQIDRGGGHYAEIDTQALLYHDKTESSGRLANEDCRDNEFMLCRQLEQWTAMLMDIMHIRGRLMCLQSAEVVDALLTKTTGEVDTMLIYTAGVVDTMFRKQY